METCVETAGRRPSSCTLTSSQHSGKLESVGDIQWSEITCNSTLVTEPRAKNNNTLITDK
jgi:hypothetical protein